MILCNGTPKSGTNLLVKAVRLFDGLTDKAHHGHLHPDDELLQKYDKLVVIHRFPINVLGSWLRFTKKPFTQDSIIREMPERIKAIEAFFPYLDDPNVHNVKFEELLTNPSVIEGIGEFLGKPLASNHFDRLWGGTPTFNADQTDYRTWWNKELDDVWSDLGGYRLEDYLDYKRGSRYGKQQR